MTRARPASESQPGRRSVSLSHVTVTVSLSPAEPPELESATDLTVTVGPAMPGQAAGSDLNFSDS